MAARSPFEIADPVAERDPEFVQSLLPLMEVFNRYFDAEVRGIEHLPKRGPMLLVGNHSGGGLTPDTTAVMAAWYRARGVAQPLIGLALDAVFRVPGLRTFFLKLGEVPANQGNAARALDGGAAVLVYPGGAHEAYRPWTDRHRIDFNGRTGFITLALRKGVPVVPVVGHGGHDSAMVLARGDALAARLLPPSLRVDVFPLLFKIPWGIAPAGLPALPLPAKITVQIGRPMRWSRYDARAADDPRVLRRCYDEITGTMQRTLDALAKETPYPVLRRLGSLWPDSAPRPRRPAGTRRARSK
jgi:1-acyl-sn-glycerol-3-phosphate acyltransferase